MENTLLIVLGTLVVGMLSAGGVILSNISGRLRLVEDELKAEQANNRILWLVYKKLLDLYYKWRIDGAPEPPELPKEL